MTKTRLSAAERSEQLVAAAVTAFAESGYKGTTTDEIARLAGVSQPYVIRLFGSKRNLFVAALEHACGQIERIFRKAAAEKADLTSLGRAYTTLLAERELLTLLLHGYAASADDTIGSVIRERYGRIYELVRDLTGSSPEDARNFMGIGMLLTVLASIRVAGPDAVTPEPWMAELLGTLAPPNADV